VSFLQPELIGRDDHALCTAADGSFMCFGGFVNGSRSNELCHFGRDGTVNMRSDENPIPARAGHSVVHHNSKLFVFGGTDDDNDKLGDLWCFNTQDQSCKKIESPEGAVCPVPRSGHTATVSGDHMFIFGGILELTKDLNDLSVFDMAAEKWVKAIEDPFAEEKEK
jgi:N-acetylneuraminic acid mutarotase